MIKKIAFLSMPYRADTIRGIVENIRAAETCAINLWRAGFIVICPHLNTALFDGVLPDEVWLDGDIEIMKRCDVVVMGPKWETSSGSKHELQIACQIGKDIIYYNEIVNI